MKKNKVIAVNFYDAPAIYGRHTAYNPRTGEVIMTESARTLSAATKLQGGCWLFNHHGKVRKV